jgi:hypothetical protein
MFTFSLYTELDINCKFQQIFSQAFKQRQVVFKLNPFPAILQEALPVPRRQKFASI